MYAPNWRNITHENIACPENPEVYRFPFSFPDHRIARIAHFATAFFGYHLQGREDFAEYFSEDFIAQFDDLFWGVYEK
jgi:hypothetical protein